MPIDNVAEKPYYSTRAAAKLLNVSLGTVQKMVERGELSAWKTHGGHRRIYKEDVHNLLATRVGNHPVETEHELDLVVFHPNHQEAQKLHAQLAKWGLPLKSAVVEDVLDTIITSVSSHPQVVLYYVEALTPAETARIGKLHQFFDSRKVVFAVITARSSYDAVAEAMLHWGVMVFLKTPTLEEVKGFVRAQLLMGRGRA